MNLMNRDLELLPNINNWINKTKGLYRFVVSSGCCYEILLTHYDAYQPIEVARAELYLAGEWFKSNEQNGVKITKSYFEREKLTSGTVKECLQEATKDYTEYMDNVKDMLIGKE